MFLVVAVVCAAGASVLARFSDGRLVLLGPVDSDVVVGGLIACTVWSAAVFTLGRVRWTPSGNLAGGLAILVRGAFAFATFVLGAFFVTVPAAFTSPHYRLDVPGRSEQLVVTALQGPGETSVSVWSGSGMVFDHVDLGRLPYAAPSDAFEEGLSVQADPDGSFVLIYPSKGGAAARVPIPE